MKNDRLRWTVITIVAVIVVALLGIVVYLGIFREFDAKGYVEAVLSQYVEGDTTLAEEIFEDSTAEALQQQYEKSIVSFVEANITAGIELSEEEEGAYVSLCKQIFQDAEFEVQEAEKIDRETYIVPVNYRSVNLFELFEEALVKEQERLNEKVEKGEYKGTIEEIKQQMQDEFVENAYLSFEAAYQNMEYSDMQTDEFTVSKQENGDFEVEGTKITEFMAKIIGIHENQG